MNKFIIVPPVKVHFHIHTFCLVYNTRFINVVCGYKILLLICVCHDFTVFLNVSVMGKSVCVLTNYLI